VGKFRSYYSKFKKKCSTAGKLAGRKRAKEVRSQGKKAHRVEADWLGENAKQLDPGDVATAGNQPLTFIGKTRRSEK